MALRDDLVREMNAAAKAQDRVRLSTIRLLRASIKNREIAVGHELSDAEVIEAVASQIKQRRESIAQFREAGRLDLAEREQAELEVLQRFLPDQLSHEELLERVARAIERTRARGPKDMGAVMKALMPEVTGRADGKVVADLVRDALSRLPQPS